MAARITGCDRTRLQRLLDGQLPDSAQTEVAAHVETCETCRFELELLAADDSVWLDVRHALSDDGSSGFDEPGDASSSVPLDFLAPSDNPAMLGRIGEFEILELIGSGGMGIVLKGYDHELNRYVAVKVLHPHCATSAAARRRFAREAQAAAAVVHQHVVAIHAVGANHHPPYLVMPFVPGESLQDRLTRQGSLDVIDALRIGQQVAEGLAAAHAQGLVHRDIKPGNILLERNVDRVLLTDFGLARAADDASLTQSGVIAGTPQYMSPEQARGENVDERTDLFSLGTVMYTLLAGHSPFRAETAMGVLRRVCEDTPRPLREVNPSVPAWLEKLIARLHERDAADRFASAELVAELLKGCLAHVQQPTQVPLPADVARLVQQGGWRLPGGRRGSLMLAAALILCMTMWWNLTGPRSVTSDPIPIPQQAVTPGSTISAPSLPDWDDKHPEEVRSVNNAIQRLENETADQF